MTTSRPARKRKTRKPVNVKIMPVRQYWFVEIEQTTVERRMIRVAAKDDFEARYRALILDGTAMLPHYVVKSANTVTSCGRLPEETRKNRDNHLSLAK